MSKVLIVDDDQTLADMIGDWLKAENFIADVVYTGSDAKALLEDFHYDLVVLDWELPDLSGMDVLKHYRLKDGKGHVVMLTGRDQIDDIESGFATGADDYLTKPFEIRELIARLRALGRRPRSVYQEVIRVRDLSLNPTTREVFVDERKVELLPKEFDVLEHLMRHAGHVFNAEALIDRVWNSESSVGGDTVRTCIKKLRKVLDKPGEKSHIETQYGAGYRLLADDNS